LLINFFDFERTGIMKKAMTYKVWKVLPVAATTVAAVAVVAALGGCGGSGFDTDTRKGCLDQRFFPDSML
jgi:hypothetical protein